MKRCRSHNNPYLSLLQKTQGSSLFISHIPQVVSFVDGDGEERSTKDGTGESLLRLRDIPRTGPLLLRFSVRPHEVLEEDLDKRVSALETMRKRSNAQSDSRLRCGCVLVASRIEEGQMVPKRVLSRFGCRRRLYRRSSGGIRS